MLQFPDSHTHTHTHLAPDESVARPPHTHTHTRTPTHTYRRVSRSRHGMRGGPSRPLLSGRSHTSASCRYYPHFLWMWPTGHGSRKHSGFVCWSCSFLSVWCSALSREEHWFGVSSEGSTCVVFRSRLATAAAASVHSDPAAGQRSSHSSQERSEPEIWNTAWDFKTSGIREPVLTLTLYSLTHKEESGTFQSGIVRIQTAQTEQ